MVDSRHQDRRNVATGHFLTASIVDMDFDIQPAKTTDLSASDISSTTPAVEEQVETPPADALDPHDRSGDLTPEQVAEIPEVQKVLNGEPAAVKILRSERTPLTQKLSQNVPAVLKLGLSLYRTIDGEANVVFNNQILGADEVKAADEAGTLDDLAAPLSAISNEPVEKVSASPEKENGATPEEKIPVGPAPAPMPAKSQSKLTSARLTNLAPVGPTDRQTPGAGQILNDLQKRPV